LTILFVLEGSNLRIGLHDRGRPFDPTQVAPPDMNVPLEERPVGGLGMHLMHQLMDEVTYSFTPEGNTLTMTKNGVAGALQTGSLGALHEGPGG
jgi:serine/threonine-protein kinase RsbW